MTKPTEQEIERIRDLIGDYCAYWGVKLETITIEEFINWLIASKQEDK